MYVLFALKHMEACKTINDTNKGILVQMYVSIE